MPDLKRKLAHLSAVQQYNLTLRSLGRWHHMIEKRGVFVQSWCMMIAGPQYRRIGPHDCAAQIPARQRGHHFRQTGVAAANVPAWCHAVVGACFEATLTNLDIIPPHALYVTLRPAPPPLAPFLEETRSLCPARRATAAGRRVGERARAFRQLPDSCAEADCA
jgi:hypothetical protein